MSDQTQVQIEEVSSEPATGNNDTENLSKKIVEIIKKQESTIGITSSPSTTIEIYIDIREESKLGRILGQMVYFIVNEEEKNILVIGQVISIKTQNRWHEDPAFKGVIRMHGNLPHLSGKADNRLAIISVQSAYLLEDEGNQKSYILGTSPSTGISVKKMTNEIMEALMEPYRDKITYMGTVYGTDVNLPFWFKHFDKGDNGNGSAHHIGVFGKTGSGKSVAAAYMLLGYAKNKDFMNIMVLDPQRQFYQDQDFPFSFAEKVEESGMKFQKFELLKDIYLPGTAYELFASLLMECKFMKNVFRITTLDKQEDALFAIARYLENFNELSQGREADLNNLNTDDKSYSLFKNMVERFSLDDDEKYSRLIFAKGARLTTFKEDLKNLIDNESLLKDAFTKYWQPIINFFIKESNKKSIQEIVSLIAGEEKGNFIVIDISGEQEDLAVESIQAMFVKIIENEIKNVGQKLWGQGKKVNCLIVMDEAHRFVSHETKDPHIIELTNEIIDSVRTTRKYGIGYMFITQTIESMDQEILNQTRIFAFGYGLTIGSEIRTISNIINNENAIGLYKSFIDPSSSERFPFMFHGAISPLSFTGSPLFLEVYTDPEKFR